MRFVLCAHLHDLHLAAHDHVELVPRLAGVEELVAGRAGLVAQVAQRAVLRELELEPLEELDAAEHLRELPEVLLRPLLRRSDEDARHAVLELLVDPQVLLAVHRGEHAALCGADRGGASPLERRTPEQRSLAERFRLAQPFHLLVVENDAHLPVHDVEELIPFVAE